MSPAYLSKIEEGFPGPYLSIRVTTWFVRTRRSLRRFTAFRTGRPDRWLFVQPDPRTIRSVAGYG